MTESKEKSDPLRNLAENLFDSAGRWRIGGLVIQVLLFAVGFGSLWLAEAMIWPTIMLAVLTLLHEGVLWWSNRRYGQGQSLQRTLDLRESFGWEPSEGEIRDFTVRTPRRFKELRNFARVGTYFASKSDAGPKKALENLIESSWWSKHLCEKLVWVYGFAAGLLTVGSLFTLVWSIANVEDSAAGLLLGKAVTSVVLLIFSLNIVRLFFAYQAFARDADKIQASAASLLRDAAVDEITALRLWGEYQSLRNVSPPIPGWVWQIFQKNLNEAYAATPPKG